MSTIPQQQIDNIKANYPIRAVVSRWIELDKNGRACCPFHQEKSPSFKVSEDGYYKCFGCGAGGDVISFVQTYKAVDFKEACEIITGQVIEPERTSFKNGRIIMLSDQMAEGPEETPKAKPAKKTANKFQALWEAKVSNFTDEYADSVALNRGLDGRIFRWLRENNLIGLHNSKYVAFPVHDDAGNVVRCHVKDHDKDTWMYEPQGGTEKGTQSLIIGDTKVAKTTFALESQWDAFAIMSALHHWESPNDYAYIITRGASSNTDISKHVNPDSRLILIPQNDPEDKKDNTGKTPAEKWLDRCKAGLPVKVTAFIANTPEGYKDPNDWIAQTSPSKEAVIEQFLSKLTSPTLLPYYTITDLMNYPIQEDPNAMIGTKRRFLCKAGSMVIIGPSGAGKSTLMASIMSAWAMGRKWNGIDVRKPMKQLVIQAENDQGDVAEMVQGTLYALSRAGKFRKEEYDDLLRNCVFVPVSGLIGEDFVASVERQIAFHCADIVWIDPILSYIGGDISKQEVSSHFFRKLIDPMLKRTGSIAIMMHHTGKPAKQDGKVRIEQSVKELAYSGLGSSDLVNWARAIMVLGATADPKVYRLSCGKRDARTGMIDYNGIEGVDSIYLRQGEPNEGLSWTLCEAPAEDIHDMKKSDREAMDFYGFPFPMKWDDMIDLLVKTKGFSKKNAASLLGKAVSAKLISCPDRNGLWVMGDRTLREQPEF